MKCKYCQTELEAGITLCPACGKEQDVSEEVSVADAEEISAAEAEEVSYQEEIADLEEETAVPEIKEGIKATPGKIALAIVAGVVVLALLLMIVLSGIDGDLFKKSETVPAAPEATETAEPATEGTIPPDGNPDDVTCKGSYSVSDEELEAALDTVVATMGDEELTLGDLQIYYWEAVYALNSELGAYASQIGLDLTQGLDRQLCLIGDVSMTWQQYFLDYALNSWHTHQAVAMAGKEAGYELEDMYREELDSLPAQIQEMVTAYGLTDADQWVREYIGPGCTMEDYLRYLETYYRGYGYLEHLRKNTTFTAEEVEAYFTERQESYEQGGVTKDAGKVVDVRHILLMPENGTTGEDGYPAYSEEDWATCEAEVQKIYDEWQAGDKSEQSFHDYAAKYSQDGNAAQGGIYEGVTQGYMVEAFDSWCFDESRQPGDHGLVKTQYGFHIMFFVDSHEIWYSAAEADMINDAVTVVLPAAKESYPMTVDYSAIKLGVVEFAAQ